MSKQANPSAQPVVTAAIKSPGPSPTPDSEASNVIVLVQTQTPSISSTAPPENEQQSPGIVPAGPFSTPAVLTTPSLSPLPLSGMLQTPAPSGLPESDAPAAKGTTNVLFVVMVVAAVAAVVVAAYLLLARKRDKNAPKLEGAGSAFAGVRVGNTHHIGRRDSQQDSFGISDLSNKELYAKKGLFAVLADGMGGLSNGAQMSAIVTGTMLRYFSETTFHSENSIELLNMLSLANREANAYIARNGQKQCGSTVVAVIVKDGLLSFISVGDSRLCVVRNGRMIQINREHTYASELDEKAARGEITFEDAAYDPQRNALTSYIGMGELSKIDRSLRPTQLQSGDKVLLMSDGVFGTLTDDEMIAGLDADIHESAMRLEQAVLSKNKQHQDNFTAIIIEYRE